MSDPTTVITQTNLTPNSCVDVQCDCNTMWSMAQEFAHLRLSDKTGAFKARLIKSYPVRARRIAATYARFYLEQEDGGNPALKGRFYWMALGAFASKTVACTLESWQVGFSKTTKNGLGKGNFWLFCDISGWHWYYSNYAKTFDMCRDRRNAAAYVPAVKSQVDKLPWSAEALGKINNLGVSAPVKAGFAKVREFEQETDPTLRPNIQLKHLLDIADHEQGVILQPLIYDDPDFAGLVELQRKLRRVTPDLELVFTAACGFEAEAVTSKAPKDMELERFASRMKWIVAAADKFHNLMQQRPMAMEHELQTIAGWVAKPDE